MNYLSSLPMTFKTAEMLFLGLVLKVIPQPILKTTEQMLQ